SGSLTIVKRTQPLLRKSLARLCWPPRPEKPLEPLVRTLFVRVCLRGHHCRANWPTAPVKTHQNQKFILLRGTQRVDQLKWAATLDSRPSCRFEVRCLTLSGPVWIKC